MTTLVIPLVLLALAALLIVALGVHEKRQPDKPPPLSEFEEHQRRVRAARRRAEWRSRQRTIEREREKL